MKKRNALCSTCGRPDVALIDSARGSQRAVARKFGIPLASLQRHQEHTRASAAQRRAGAPVAPPHPASAPQAPDDGPLDPRVEAEAGVRAARRALAAVEGDTMATPRERSSAIGALTTAIRMLASLEREREFTEDEIAKMPAFRRILNQVEAFLKANPQGPEIARGLIKAFEGPE